MGRRKTTIGLLIGLGLLAAVVAVRCWPSRATDSDLAAADEALSRREFGRAYAHFEAYLASHPDRAEVHLLAAQTARRQSNYLVAATHLRKYEELHGPRERSELEYRLIRMQQGRATEAAGLLESYASKLVDRDAPLVMEAVAVGILNAVAPSQIVPGSLSDQALPLLKQGRQAVDLWLALRDGPADQQAGLVWRGRIRVLSGDQAGGVADLGQAVELAPDDLSARTHLALAVVRGDPAQAAVHLAYVRDRKGATPEIEFALATTYRTLGRLADAVAVLDDMLAADPRSLSPLVERGLAAMDVPDLEGAERFLRRAIEVAPEDPDANLAMSQYLQVRGDIAKAQEYLIRFQRFDAAKKRK